MLDPPTSALKFAASKPGSVPEPPAPMMMSVNPVLHHFSTSYPMFLQDSRVVATRAATWNGLPRSWVISSAILRTAS